MCSLNEQVQLCEVAALLQLLSCQSNMAWWLVSYVQENSLPEPV